MKKFLIVLSILVLGFSNAALAENNHVNVHYDNDVQLHDFVWRMTGNKTSELSEATFVLQEVGAKVQNKLGMISPGLNFEIILKDDVQKTTGRIAFYNLTDKKIYTDPKNVTPGILAHEMAHAIMCAWEGKLIPHESQEILAQAIETHLDEV